MNHPPYIKLRVAMVAVALGVAFAGSVRPAHAQTATDAVAAAQRQYEQDLALCNNGSLAAPQRDACVRDAGSLFDRQRGVPAQPAPGQSADGRATVMAPSGASATLRGTTTTTTTDGRATVVVPETNAAQLPPAR